MMKKMDDEKVNRARLNCGFYISASITAKKFMIKWTVVKYVYFHRINVFIIIIHAALKNMFLQAC